MTETGRELPELFYLFRYEGRYLVERTGNKLDIGGIWGVYIDEALRGNTPQEARQKLCKDLERHFSREARMGLVLYKAQVSTVVKNLVIPKRAEIWVDFVERAKCVGGLCHYRARLNGGLTPSVSRALGSAWPDPGTLDTGKMVRRLVVLQRHQNP